VTREPFERIVRQHGPTVLRVCRALLGPVEAEDAWSETFLAALRVYPELPPSRNIEAWLVTVARRKAIDQHRATMRNPVPVEEVPADPADPIGDAEPRSLDDELLSALRSLPTRQREAIVYHYLAGLPYAEVADILGNSESAARRAAADGIKTLRTIYQGARP
jgi:RNA polymerase sigma factor (sigma-70 family)